MANPLSELHNREHTILENVHEGMDVYDADNKLLGKIDGLYLGEASLQSSEIGDVPATVSAPRPASDAMIAVIQRVFGKDELPQEVKERLLQHGFVHVNVPGLLAHNRYVMPEQITQVTNEGIVLRATRAQLLKA